MDLAYTVSGFVVGFIVGMTGVGGGSLMTPLLVLVFGISPAVAVGTDLLYAAITKSGGSWVHAKRRTVNWKIAGLLGAGSIPASVITVFLLRRFVPDIKELSTLITTVLGVALILTACTLLFKDQIREYARTKVGAPVWSEKDISIITVLVGVVLGVLVTISSVGAGALGAAMLFLLYPRLTAVQIVGTDIVHAVPLTAVAGLGHVALGSVDWVLLGSLLLGSLPGIYFGSHLAAKIPERVLRPTLAGMLVLIGGKLVF